VQLRANTENKAADIHSVVKIIAMSYGTGNLK
jgi:hypothetical protein